MSKSLEEQKELLVDAVLELQKKLNALKYLLVKGKQEDKPEIKVAIGVFNDLFFFIHGLLWDSIVVNLYWLYDKKGQRSIYWYLAQLKKSEPSFEQKINEQVKEIDKLESEIKRVKKFRNKWIAHKDKEPFEKSEDFWKREETLTIEEVQKLVETASKIVQIECPIVDTTNHGIHKLFALTHLIVSKNPDFLWKMEEYKVLERIDYSELQTLCQQSKQQ
jgi:hypothetical protein